MVRRTNLKHYRNTYVFQNVELHMQKACKFHLNRARGPLLINQFYRGLKIEIFSSVRSDKKGRRKSSSQEKLFLLWR